MLFRDFFKIFLEILFTSIPKKPGNTIFTQKRKEMHMKKLLLILFSALTLTSLTTVSYAEGISKASVTGMAVIYAPADRVTISYVVEDKGKGEKALSKTAEEIQKSVAEYGTATLDGYFSYTDHNGNTVLARTYVICSQRIKDVSALMNKLISGGATSVSSPTYSLENRSEWENKALKAAFEKAKARAIACGIKGDPSTIHDFGSDPSCCHFSFSPCSDGKVQIECRVVLRYNNG
jgi:hypothetical protein